MIEYKQVKELDLDQLSHLYKDVGWTGYTQDPSIMRAIIPQSYQVIAAFEGDELIGLIRSLSDGVYILYIQDILVKRAYQRKGIGSELLKRMLEGKTDIKQKVLLTDFEEKTMAFYEKNGFHAANSKDWGVAFVRYDH